MNTFEFIRSLEKITPEVIREIGVQAVQENEQIVVSDSIVANAEGLTFAGNNINEYKPFTDWEETGEFHENLRFQSEKDIEFTSRGDGAVAVFSTFPDNDTIAPHAKTLSEDAMQNIKKSFIEILSKML